ATTRPPYPTLFRSSKLYGASYSFAGSEFSVAASDATSGLVNGDTVSSVSLSSPGAAAAAAAGPYTITAAAPSTGSGLGNYTISYDPNTTRLTTSQLTITANEASKLYGTTQSFAA